MISVQITVDTKEEAKKNILTAIDKYPNDWQVLVRCASYYKDERMDLGQALTWINSAIKLKDDHYLPYWVKGEILALDRDFIGAIEYAQKALDLGKKNENFAYETLIRSQIALWKQQK